MASTIKTELTTAHCEPCQYNIITVPAVVWCLSCEEGLCQSCADSHKGIKATRSHKVIPVEKCHVMCSLSHLFSQQCEKHNLIIDLYCSTHDEPGCRLCITNKHRECKDITDLDDIANNVVSSSSFSSLDEEVGNLLSVLSKATENRKENKRQLEKAKTSIHFKIQEVRQQLNTHLDKLETALQNELSSAYGSCESKVDTTLAKIETITLKVHSIQTNISDLKELATNVQLFLASRDISKLIAYENVSFKKLLQENAFVDLTLKFNITQELDMMKSLGSISVTKNPSKIQLADPKVKDAQLLVTKEYREITKVSLNYKITLTCPEEKSLAFGCKIKPNGDLLFVDGSHNQITVFNSNGKLIKNTKLPDRPSDLTLLSEDRIAVSYGNCEMFEIADFKDYNYKILNTVKTEYTCWGISYEDSTIAVKISSPDGIDFFRIGRFEGYRFVELNSSDGIGHFYNLAMFRGKLYATLTTLNSVICTDLQGKELWRYQCDYLERPNGITIDKYGNVFVAGEASRNIVVISNDGKESRELLGKTQFTPLSLDFVKMNNLLLVRYKEGQAVMYDVKYDN